MSFKPTIKPQIDPNTTNIKEVLSYKGVDYWRWKRTFKSYRRALPWVLLPLGFTLLTSPKIYLDSMIDIRGEDGKGGELLEVKTIYDNHELEYNREFQRMRYLTEPMMEKMKSDRETEQYLIDRGIDVDAHQSHQDYRKKAPHYKYY